MKFKESKLEKSIRWIKYSEAYFKPVKRTKCFSQWSLLLNLKEFNLKESKLFLSEMISLLSKKKNCISTFEKKKVLPIFLIMLQGSKSPFSEGAAFFPWTYKFYYLCTYKQTYKQKRSPKTTTDSGRKKQFYDS